MSDRLETVSYGIILGCENYDACVAFYRDKLGLPVWYDKGHLICLKMGDAYLMIETGGKASTCVKGAEDNPTMLRFNVHDVAEKAARLRTEGIAVNVMHYPWGTVGTFADPDGNKCELKNADDPFFTRSNDHLVGS